MAAPPAVGSEAINAPTNGPERSTTTEAATTMLAVITIFSSRPDEKHRFRRHGRSPWRAGARKTATDCNNEAASVSVSASASRGDRP